MVLLWCKREEELALKYGRELGMVTGAEYKMMLKNGETPIIFDDETWSKLSNMVKTTMINEGILSPCYCDKFTTGHRYYWRFQYVVQYAKTKKTLAGQKKFQFVECPEFVNLGKRPKSESTGVKKKCKRGRESLSTSAYNSSPSKRSMYSDINSSDETNSICTLDDDCFNFDDIEQSQLDIVKFLSTLTPPEQSNSEQSQLDIVKFLSTLTPPEQSNSEHDLDSEPIEQITSSNMEPIEQGTSSNMETLDDSNCLYDFCLDILSL